MTVQEDEQAWGQRLPGVRAMWPGAAPRVTRRPLRKGSLLVLPRASTPRMLVPADVGGAHLMLQRHATGRLRRVTQVLVGGAQRTGLLGLLPLQRLVPDEDGTTIEQHVRALVPQAHRVGVLLGPPRANAKPVLQVFAADGRTIAFGKLGHDATTTALVEAEAAVLNELSGRQLTTVEIPSVISCGSWNGMYLLLMTALSGSQQRGISWELPFEAMAEVAEEPGGGTEALAGGSYVGSLRSRLATSAEPRLGEVLDRLEAAAGAVSLQLGRWHGDWAPWNMARTGGQVQVWDWERSVTGVPVGLDVVHFQVQREVQAGSSPDSAVEAALTAVRTAGERWGYDHRQRSATLMLYLVEVWHRYASGSGTTPTPALRRRMGTIERMVDVALGEWRS